jgi:pimeloyl-ACP methyl ester carboxylesterase
MKWIFLRGLGRSPIHWGDFDSIWKKHFPQDEIIHWTLPGCGSRYKESSPLNLQSAVADLREFLKNDPDHESHPKYNVLALSLGGMIAAEWLQQAPHEIASMVFINSSSKGHSPIFDRIKPHAILTLIQSGQKKSSYERELNILRLTTNTTPHLKKWAQVFAEDFDKNPVSPLNIGRQLVAASRTSWPLKDPSPEIPKLFLTAVKDRMVSYHCSKKISESWNCPLEIHPTAGHELLLDAPDWCIEKISKHLRPQFEESQNGNSSKSHEV